MTQVPDLARGLVITRDRYLCQRCGMKGTDWHHRRTRSVRDDHTHCACNGVLLCRTCHQWAHAHPFLARGRGLIVSRYTNPADVSVFSATMGLIRLDCDGGFTWVNG